MLMSWEPGHTEVHVLYAVMEWVVTGVLPLHLIADVATWLVVIEDL